MDAFYVGASGMVSQQLNVETIANNLANATTPAFKKSRVQFQELFYREVGGAQRRHAADGVGLGAIPFGAGVAVAGVDRDLTPGQITQSSNPLDVAINGPGFLQVTQGNGGVAYTRLGALQVNKDGMLATSDGNLLHPAINVPENATDIQIDPTGLVTMASQSPIPTAGARDELGQIELATFPAPAGLKSLGASLFVPTEQSGDAVLVKPGTDSSTTLQQGYIESSNVQLVDELTGLLIAQRIYEANSKIVQASDDMLSIVNNLRR